MMDKEQKKEVVKVCGVFAAFLLVAIIGQFSVGCSPRVLPSTEVRDSVRVEIRERVVHDTAVVEIPLVQVVNVTRDSSSHLENAYASSDASVTDGLLKHSLQSKPQKVYVPVTVEVHDTTVVTKQAERVIKEVQVERELTAWQRLSMSLGRSFLGLLLLGAAFWAVKKFVFKK